jgi:hypothetical protein
MYLQTKVFIIFFVFIAAILTGCNTGGSVSVNAVSGTLLWSAPTSYTDGNPLGPSDLKGYRIYYRTETESYSVDNSYFVPVPTTSASIQSLKLAPGIYYFVVTAVDSADVESDFSNEKLVRI